MKQYIYILLLFSLVFETVAFAADDVSLPENFQLQTVASGLGLATGFAFAAGNRIFVTTKDGLVRVVQDGELLETPFIDLNQSVNDAGDRGLTDVAVHPDFPSNPYIYLAYVYDPPELNSMGGLAALDARGRRVSRLTRYTANSEANFNQVLPGSELDIVGKNSAFDTMGTPNLNRDQGDIACMQGESFIADCLPSDDYSHVVGSVLFAADGSLYMGYGDGSTVAPYPLPMTLRTLDIDSMAGKILRVDPETGQGYPDNPFYDGDPNSNRSKVINYGLRNPYGFTLDSLTNEVYMADTGWVSWEEINSGRGKNFGWPCYEGGNGWSNRQPVYAATCANYLDAGHSVSAPLFAYEHAQKGGAITGIEVYRGESYPDKYRGAVFYSDFIRNEVSVVTLSDGQFQDAQLFAENWQGVSKVRRGPDANLYFLNLFEGTLSRLLYVDGTAPKPVANITADRFYGSVPLKVSFSGLSSYDPQGGELTYQWYFGDGNESSEASPQHTYLAEGDFAARLEVNNAAGAGSSSTFTINAGKELIVEFGDALASTRYVNGEEVFFEASILFDEANIGASISDTRWMAYIGDDADNALPLSMVQSLRGSFKYPELQQNEFVTLCLFVTILEGVEDKRCTILHPLMAEVSLLTEPLGLSLTFNKQEVVTPQVLVLHVGSTASVSATDNSGYAFESWSKSEAKDISFVVTAEDMVFKAVYRKPSGGLGSFGLMSLLYLLAVFVAQEKYCHRRYI